MKRAGLAAGVLTSISMVAFLPPESQAGVRVAVGVHVDSERGYGYGPYRQAYRHGYERGLQDGYRHGAGDSRHDRHYDLWDDKRYRRADTGYKGWMGPRSEYRNGYRRGYEEGYRRAYARYDWDRDGGWRGGHDRRPDGRWDDPR